MKRYVSGGHVCGGLAGMEGKQGVESGGNEVGVLSTG